MKGLKTLVRMNRLKLEDKQRQLAELEGVANGFRSQIASLEDSVSREADGPAQAPDSAHMIGDFVQAALRRKETLLQSLKEVEEQVAEIRDEVAAAFREIKRFELIMERREAASQREADRRARKTENETALSMFRLRKNTAPV